MNNWAESSDISKLVLFVYVMYVVHVLLITVTIFILRIPHVAKYVYGDAIVDIAFMIFIVDACITKNVPQMKSYILLKAVSMFYFFINGKISPGRFLAIIVGIKVVLVDTTLAVV